MLLTEEDIIESFPIGSLVSGPNNENGVVKYLDRNQVTGAMGLQVEWEGSGITAFTNPSQVRRQK